jgi:hypothetical protein
MSWKRRVLAPLLGASLSGCPSEGGDGQAATATEPTGGVETGANTSAGSDDEDSSEAGSSQGSADEGSSSESGDDTGGTPAWPEYDANPFEFELAFPVPIGTARGAIFVHEIDGDGLYDFIVTGLDNLAVYDHFGVLLWHEMPPIHMPESANGGYGAIPGCTRRP